MESLIPPENAAKTSAETINRHIGWCLATRRRALGLSQRELADASDLSHRQIRDYERVATPIAAALRTGRSDHRQRPTSGGIDARFLKHRRP